MKCYLAGPDVFLPNPLERGKYMKEFCALHGFVGLYPFDNDANAPTAENIFKNNIGILYQADIVIANMQPFHGPSMDVGTVWEIGFACALKKPVIGYTNDHRILKERIIDWNGPLIDGKYTKDGMAFDDFDEIENLMIAKSVDYVADSFENAVLYAKKIYGTPSKKSYFQTTNTDHYDDMLNFVVPPYGDFDGC